MFASKRKRTTISEGLTVVGLITSDGEVEVRGTVEGDIHCAAVLVADKGRVSGSIRADNVVVDGRVEGPIACREIVFHRNANLVGDVECETVVIEKGALMQGRLTRAGRPNLSHEALGVHDERRAKDENVVDIENTSRRTELIVAARALSGNPNLPGDEALAFLAKRGNAQAKALVDDNADSGRKPHANRHN